MGGASVTAYAPKPGNAGWPSGASNPIRLRANHRGKGKHLTPNKKGMHKGGTVGARMQSNDTPLDPWQAWP